MAEKKAPSRIDGMRAEMRKIQWPTSSEVVQYTTIVLVIAAVVATFGWILDLIYGWLVGLVI
ncbi:preprotein translocase subunit SecE [Murdochiella massiliensis]|uniref:preprotein translocase subunit SecE n=1 Tax=Murdochiella massiliensis TaxID=1673723 RepID=UPI000832791E|nr:preprotein translocase subunit SecE [Murdochiella massiliensis]MBY0583866.1 preprotein translocase subunit SecE [Murdochiella sp. Marseille-P8839]